MPFISARPSGYADPAYAASLGEWGTPLALPHSKGSLLVRSIPGCGERDAIGPYPVFSCLDWAQLPVDIAALRGDLVSVTLVTAPFGNWSAPLLARAFPDLSAPYKEHFVVDLRREPLRAASAHHRRKALRAAARVDLERTDDPRRLLKPWTSLYEQLIRRHHISGLQEFSPAAFAKQLSLPGMVAVRAIRAQETVSMSLWLVENDIAYYHLGASNELGYQLEASYALFAFALGHFNRAGVAWASLGAGAGVRPHYADGLSRFKAGWATGTRTVYLCGRILDPRRYTELVRTRSCPHADYFPAYRREASL